MKSKAFNRLERVLKLEKSYGCKNTAVVGGIRQFANFWVEQARGEAVDEGDKALVEQIAESLTDYNNLPGPEARGQLIDNLLGKIQARKARLPQDKKPDQPPQKQEKRSQRGDPKPQQQEKRAQQDNQKPQREQSNRPKREQTNRPKQDRQNRSSKSTSYSKGEPQERLPKSSKWYPLPEIDMEMAVPDPEGLAQTVTKIKGIGPKVGEHLTKLGVTSILDLLYLFPRRHDDYTRMIPIQQLKFGDQVTVIGTIWETRARRTRNNQVVVQSVVSDGTAKIQATWFNQPWIADKLQAGSQIVLSGTVDQYLGRLVLNSPEWEPLEIDPLKTRRIVPVYPLTQGLSGNRLRDFVRTAVKEWAAKVPDPLPEPIREKHSLFSLPQAIQQQHFPDNHDALFHSRKRLVFDEHFLLQLGMQTQRQEWQSSPSTPIPNEPVHMVRFRNALSFELTGAQRRVIDEILGDMALATAMNRLLQGDVGAGKTVVAAAAIVATVESGMQAALMAPTEILAEQHFQGLSRLLEPLGYELRLLTGSTPAAEKTTIYNELAMGNVQIAIGTHALIQEAVNFKNLGLAVIDEQHRFGVDQRKALREKGEIVGGEPHTPHVLVMSATPIPRSLALSLYGDLDLSILDEMPPGRQEIRTKWMPTRDRERAYRFIERQADEGRQAYIIYPLVEESEAVDAKSAVEEYDRLQKQVFPKFKLGLIHGRLSSTDKEEAMRAFYSGETDILVSTTVIEVGVDVPNATVMMVDGANRFGLAQLHQLRGRVGRGEHQSYCMLISDAGTAVAEERLTALEQTNDGFALAEKDLEIRGPGEFFGRRQSGLPELQLASLLDMEMLEMTQQEARAIVEKDPNLEMEEHQALRERVSRFWETAGDVS
ncbi:MAG: ATP-dependent DNA helicase RecG [Chloroflexota bacterium]